MDALRLKSVRDPFALASSPRSLEWQNLVNALPLTETDINRENHQFQTLVATVFPTIAKTKAARDTVRVCSVTCSTGEEPYTLAIWMLERWVAMDRDRFSENSIESLSGSRMR